MGGRLPVGAGGGGPPARPPLFMLLFFSIFGFIGVAVILFLWTDKGFGAPPLAFKVFGSLIALGFIAMGFGLPITALLKGGLKPGAGTGGGPSGPEPAPGGYNCPNCGANIRDGEVSPSGDIKCTYCNNWWNIHRA